MKSEKTKEKENKGIIFTILSFLEKTSYLCDIFSKLYYILFL